MEDIFYYSQYFYLFLLIVGLVFFARASRNQKRREIQQRQELEAARTFIVALAKKAENQQTDIYDPEVVLVKSFRIVSGRVTEDEHTLEPGKLRAVTTFLR